jgi:hypothetical protein
MPGVVRSRQNPTLAGFGQRLALEGRFLSSTYVALSNTNPVNNVQNGASGRTDGPSSAAVNAEH